MDPQIIELLMQLFGGVPQESMVDPKGQYQDPMGPLNDALDTSQNLYSSMGFNLTDLILPPEPAAPWVNDIEVQYGSNPLWADVFEDIQSGVADPMSAVQAVTGNATPVDAEGKPVDLSQPGSASLIKRYVVQRDDGTIIDLPTKVWNSQNTDPVSGAVTTTPVVQLDLEGMQKVATDFSASMAEGLRYDAEQPDFGVYTNLDEIGGMDTVDALKQRYGQQALDRSHGMARMNGGAPQGGTAEKTRRHVGYRGTAPQDDSFTDGRRAYRGSTKDSPAPPARRGGGTPGDRRTAVQRQSAKGTSDAYNSQWDKIVARSGNQVVRQGADRQRQLDVLAAVMSLPQIMNGG